MGFSPSSLSTLLRPVRAAGYLHRTGKASTFTWHSWSFKGMKFSVHGLFPLLTLSTNRNMKEMGWGYKCIYSNTRLNVIIYFYYFCLWKTTWTNPSCHPDCCLAQHRTWIQPAISGAETRHLAGEQELDFHHCVKEKSSNPASAEKRKAKWFRSQDFTHFLFQLNPRIHSI